MEKCNIRSIVERSAKEYSDKLAFKVKLGENIYDDITFERLYKDVKSLGKYLLSEGYADKRIAVIGKNSYNWMLVFLAALSINSTIIPLDRGLLENEFNEQLLRAEADLVFLSDAFLEKIDKNSAVKCISTESDEFNKCIEEGKTVTDDLFNNVVIDENKMSILIFTSGTTSKSKAVMLSQKNIYSNVIALTKWVTFNTDDVNMAILPFHHAFGMTQIMLFIYTGVCNVFCEGLRIAKCFNEYGVSVLVGVPLIIETIYKNIIREVERQNKTQKIKLGMKICSVLDKVNIKVRRKIFKEIINKLGGKLRIIISGAAPIDPTVAEWFNNIGIILIQGYGLSETAPVVSAENETHIKYGSVGFPLPGYEVKIFEKDENGIGEIITKGDNVMLGYYNDTENTEKVLVDGWFHTGDMGYIDGDGYIFITGRKKNVIVLNNGKNVFPEELEGLISNADFVKECIVYNKPENGKDSLCAKIVYDKDLKLEINDIQVLAEEHIKEINKKLIHYKQIRNYELTNVEMEKTTTGKIKRQ